MRPIYGIGVLLPLHFQASHRLLSKAEGIPVHGATMPLPLAEFLVEYLCPPGGITTEKHLEYAFGIASRFGLHQNSLG